VHGKPNETDVNDQLGEEGFQRELSFGSRREWDDYAAHNHMNGDAVECAAKDGFFYQDRQFEADRVVDRSDGQAMRK